MTYDICPIFKNRAVFKAGRMDERLIAEVNRSLFS